MPAPSRRDRIAGAIYGLLVGDALGVPYEFHAPESLPPPELIDFAPPPGFRRAHAGVPPGTWSDDGAQALVLLHSLLRRGRVDPAHFAEGLCAWSARGFMAADGRVFDIGTQTGAAIARLNAGVAPLEAGGAGEWDNGNGSLMRVAPLALWHEGDDEALIADAFAQSRVTHGHARSLLCCALYCLWARRIFAGAEVDAAFAAAVAALRAHHPDGPLRAEFETHIASAADRPPQGSGYVVDCLFSARHALEAGDFEAVVKRAVALGHDADTTACVAGALAGLAGGVGAIPERWLQNLRGRAIADPLIEELCAL